MTDWKRIRRVLMAGAALGLIGTAAEAADWRLVEVTGPVRVAAPGAEAAVARLNQTLPIGSSVTTFQGGRATLDNGLQHVVVGPNSRMTVAPDTAGGMTRIIQDLGAIMFQVDKKAAPHFRVDTPLLAAVVKGTTFTVEVDPMANSVSVAEGLVEVRSNTSNLGRDVPAGASGTIQRDAPASIRVASLAATAAAGAPPQPALAIAPIDYKAATKGLIENAAPISVATATRVTASSGGSASTPTPTPISAPVSSFRESATGASLASSDQGVSSSRAAPTVAVTTLASHGASTEVRLEQSRPGRNGDGGLGRTASNGSGNGGAGNGNGNAAIGLTATTTPTGSGKDGSSGKSSEDNGSGGAGISVASGNGNGAVTTSISGGSSGSSSKGSDGGDGKDGGTTAGVSVGTTTVAVNLNQTSVGVNTGNGNSGDGKSGSSSGSGSGGGGGSGGSGGSDGGKNQGLVTTVVKTVTTTLPGVGGGLLGKH